MGNGSRVVLFRRMNSLPAEGPKSPGSTPAGNRWYLPVFHIQSHLSVLSGEWKNKVEAQNDLLLSHFLQLVIRD